VRQPLGKMKPPARLLQRVKESLNREITEQGVWEITLAAQCFEPENILTYTLRAPESACVCRANLELTQEEQREVATTVSRSAPSAGEILPSGHAFQKLTTDIKTALHDALLEPDALKAWEKVGVKLLVCIVVSSRMAMTTIGDALGVTLTRKDRRAVEDLEVECEEDGVDPVFLAMAVRVVAGRLSNA